MTRCHGGQFRELEPVFSGRIGLFSLTTPESLILVRRIRHLHLCRHFSFFLFFLVLVSPCRPVLRVSVQTLSFEMFPRPILPSTTIYQTRPKTRTGPSTDQMLYSGTLRRLLSIYPFKVCNLRTSVRECNILVSTQSCLI